MGELLMGLILCLISLGVITLYYFKGKRDILDRMLERGDITIEVYKKYIS